MNINIKNILKSTSLILLIIILTVGCSSNNKNNNLESDNKNTISSNENANNRDEEKLKNYLNKSIKLISFKGIDGKGRLLINVNGESKESSSFSHDLSTELGAKGVSFSVKYEDYNLSNGDTIQLIAKNESNNKTEQINMEVTGLTEADSTGSDEVKNTILAYLRSLEKSPLNGDTFVDRVDSSMTTLINKSYPTIHLKTYWKVYYDLLEDPKITFNPETSEYKVIQPCKINYWASYDEYCKEVHVFDEVSLPITCKYYKDNGYGSEFIDFTIGEPYLSSTYKPIIDNSVVTKDSIYYEKMLEYATKVAIEENKKQSPTIGTNELSLVRAYKSVDSNTSNPQTYGFVFNSTKDEKGYKSSMYINLYSPMFDENGNMTFGHKYKGYGDDRATKPPYYASNNPIYSNEKGRPGYIEIE